MSQPNSSVIPPRPAGVADAPQVSFVLRRYIWLIIIGTVLCASIGYGLFAILRRTSPRYTATVYIQVLAPPPPPGNSNVQVQSPSQDEITRFINRQIVFIRTPAVLEQILQTDEFQHDAHDPTSTKRSPWLEENIDQAQQHLLDDMEISGRPSSDVFLIQMTAKDPDEAARLTNAIARVYQASLSQDATLTRAMQLENANKQKENQELVVSRQEVALADFRKEHDIDATTSRYMLLLGVLGDVDKEYAKIQGEVIAAGQQFESIKKQVENNTLQLSPDGQREVENDPNIRYLSQIRLELEQDRQVAIANYGPAARAVKDVEIRVGVVERQLDEQRQKATAEAKVRMQTTAQSVYDGLVAQMEYLKKARDAMDTEAKDLDKFLVQAQQLTDALNEQKVVLAKLREDFAFQSLQGATDETRIRRLAGDATAPKQVSWPIAWKFVVPGAALGLLLSFGCSYLFELTNTRIRTPNDITRTLQMPLLGFVPDQSDDSGAQGELSTSVRTAPASMIAESFRQIRGRLIAEGNGAPIKTILVASIAPGGGATTVASNLANAMALNELNVLLVDANFYRPGLKQCYGNIPAFGLADLIGAPNQLDAAIVPSEQLPNLHVMGAGNVGANPAEMFESRAFRELLDLLKSRYDMIVFDGAPLSLVSDSVALGARVDGVLAVVRAGEVSRGTVARVREQLRQVRANFMGVVLNAAQTHGAGYFKENYRTFYKYAGKGARTNGAAVH